MQNAYLMVTLFQFPSSCRAQLLLAGRDVRLAACLRFHNRDRSGWRFIPAFCWFGWRVAGCRSGSHEPTGH